jgi:DNA-directed RNA polymerase specialized sigma24 family protein
MSGMSDWPRLGSRGPSATEIWLRSENLSPEERLDRLAGDADLVSALREQGFEGPDWDFVVNELVKYGIAVLGGWVRRGVIKSKCAQKGIRVPETPEHIRSNSQALEDIVAETVAEAIVYFRDDVLVPGVWDPSKGAALKTFFIGQCMKRYANVLRRVVSEQKPRNELTTDDNEILDIGRVVGVEDDAIRYLMAQQVLRGVTNHRQARALALDACKFTNAEIAQEMGTSLEGASSLIKRGRAEIRKSRENQGKGTA